MKFKRIIFIFLAIIITACSSPAQKPNESVRAVETPPDKNNVLIVYLSRTGNTEAIAKMIRENTSSDLISLELEKPYPKDYQAIVKQVSEENETGYLPPLKTKINDIQKYDTIFLGFPTWGMRLPPPLKS